MSKQINKGSVVKFVNPDKLNKTTGYLIVTSLRGGKANLGPIFGNGKTIYFKGIPVTDLVECHDEWYDKWTNSETYKCM